MGDKCNQGARIEKKRPSIGEPVPNDRHWFIHFYANDKKNVGIYLGISKCYHLRITILLHEIIGFFSSLSSFAVGAVLRSFTHNNDVTDDEDAEIYSNINKIKWWIVHKTVTMPSTCATIPSSSTSTCPSSCLFSEVNSSEISKVKWTRVRLKTRFVRKVIKLLCKIDFITDLRYETVVIV